MGIHGHPNGARRRWRSAGRGRPAGAGWPFADAAGPLAAAADAAGRCADHESLSRIGVAAVRPRGHRRRTCLVHLAMSDADRLTLVLRFADVGIVTYASLRIVGQPSRTVNWVVEEPILLAALQELAGALPEPLSSESRRDAIERALTSGPFAAPDTELTIAYVLGVLLIGAPGWQLLMECMATPRAVLFVSPSSRLARVPWVLLAVPKSGPSKEELVRARQDAITASGRVAAQIPWQPPEIGAYPDGHRLMELADVLMAVPPNIVHSPRAPAGWDARRGGPPVLVLDPRVPGQRPNPARCCRRPTTWSSCSAVRTPTGSGWRNSWHRPRVGSCMSAMPVRRTARPTARRCTWPARRRFPETPRPLATTAR